MSKRTDLDVARPEDVVKVLKNAVDMYYKSASELDSAWQDDGAEKPWEIIAKILDKAADKIEQSI